MFFSVVQLSSGWGGLGRLEASFPAVIILVLCPGVFDINKNALKMKLLQKLLKFDIFTCVFHWQAKNFTNDSGRAVEK